MADNDTDISKTHLNQAEQIVKVDFYLRLQNTENFPLNASSWCNVLIHSASCSKLMKEIYSTDHNWLSLLVDLVSQKSFLLGLGLCKTYQRRLSCSYEGHLSSKNLSTFGSETLSESIINRKLIYLFEFSYSNGLYYLVEGRNVHICFAEIVTLF